MSGKAIVAAQDEGLRAEHFYRPSRGLVWTAIEYLYEKGEPADSITVPAILDKRGRLKDAGGAAGIRGLAQTVSTISNASQYAAIVVENAATRKLQAAGKRILEISEGTGDAVDKLSEAEMVLTEATNSAGTKDMTTIGQDLDGVIAQLQSGTRRQGLKTGFLSLDEKTHGFSPGQLIILAARPGQGKSTLAQNIAEYTANNGAKVCIFSLEMTKEEIGLRMLSSQGKISLSNLQTNTLTQEEKNKLVETHTAISKLPIYVADIEEVTLGGLRAQCRRLKRQQGIDLLIVDYLQLMLAGGKVENRNIEVSQISRGLKMLARELEIPVLAVAQLSRGVEGRTDKRPVLSDLRDSGSIEQDADCVLFIYRDDYYNEDSEHKGEADVIISKQRNGVTGKVTLLFRGDHCHFKNYPGK